MNELKQQTGQLALRAYVPNTYTLLLLQNVSEDFAMQSGEIVGIDIKDAF